MAYSLSGAATAAGMSRSTIFRAIKAGRISATRTEGGNFSIEPAELHRVFPPAPATSDNHASNGAMNQGAMALSALLREQLHETRHTVDDLRRDTGNRDRMTVSELHEGQHLTAGGVPR